MKWQKEKKRQKQNKMAKTKQTQTKCTKNYVKIRIKCEIFKVLISCRKGNSREIIVFLYLAKYIFFYYRLCFKGRKLIIVHKRAQQ